MSLFGQFGLQVIMWLFMVKNGKDAKILKVLKLQLHAKWPNFNLSIKDLGRFPNEGLNPNQDKKAKKIEI